MIMPLGDENRPGAGPAFVNWSLIAINVVVFLVELRLGEPFIYGYSAVPAEITQGKDIDEPIVLEFQTPRGIREETLEHSRGPWPIYLTLLTSIFMHGGWPTFSATCSIFGFSATIWKTSWGTDGI